MTKIQFIGRVLPRRALVTSKVPELKWRLDQADIDVTFRVNIADSVINVECELEEYNHSYITGLIKRATDLARGAVDVIVFAVGHSLTVVLETVIWPDGTPEAIRFYDPATPSLCTAYNLDPERQADLDAVYRLVLTDAPLLGALHDLVEVLSVAHVACVNCGRVIDAIRRMITPPGVGLDRHAWQAMHSALNVSREYLEWISKQAPGPRHGDRTFVPGDITTEVTHRTWAVMNRFLEYRKRGNQPLTYPDFPLLQ